VVTAQKEHGKGREKRNERVKYARGKEEFCTQENNNKCAPTNQALGSTQFFTLSGMENKYTGQR